MSFNGYASGSCLLSLPAAAGERFRSISLRNYSGGL